MDRELIQCLERFCNWSPFATNILLNGKHYSNIYLKTPRMQIAPQLEAQYYRAKYEPKLNRHDQV